MTLAAFAATLTIATAVPADASAQGQVYGREYGRVYERESVRITGRERTVVRQGARQIIHGHMAVMRAYPRVRQFEFLGAQQVRVERGHVEHGPGMCVIRLDESMDDLERERASEYQFEQCRFRAEFYDDPGRFRYRYEMLPAPSSRR